MISYQPGFLYHPFLSDINHCCLKILKLLVGSWIVIALTFKFKSSLLLFIIIFFHDWNVNALMNYRDKMLLFFQNFGFGYDFLLAMSTNHFVYVYALFVKFTNAIYSLKSCEIDILDIFFYKNLVQLSLSLFWFGR